MLRKFDRMSSQWQGYLTQALQFLQQNRLDIAETTCRKALKFAPKSVDGLHILAIILYQTARTQEAIGVIDQAISLQPTNPNLYNDLGEMLRSDSRNDEAAIAYRKAISMNPVFAIAHNNLGVCLHADKRYSEAISEYEAAIAANPNYVEAHYNLGSALFKAKRFDAAVASLNKSLSLYPKNSEALRVLGDCYLYQHRSAEAVEQYQAALALRHDDADAITGAGQAYFVAEDWENASAWLERAVACYPTHVDIRLQLAEALKHQWRNKEALPHMEEALRLHPRSPKIANNLGNLLRVMGRLDDAEELMLAALTWKPDFGVLHNNLGLIYIERGLIKQATACFQEAIKLDPAVAEAYANLANTYRFTGEFDEVKRWYHKALEVRLEYDSARFSLGMAHLVLGEFGEGWADYRFRPRALHKAAWRFPEAPLPADLTGKRLYIHYDQGIGDEIFFLRFAVDLKKRGAWIAYRQYPKIASLLSRLPCIDYSVGLDQLPESEYDIPLWVSDLAFAAGMQNDSPAPPSIELRPTPGARLAIAQRLVEIGEGPYLGVTWRAGLGKDEDTPWAALFKEIPLDLLVKAIKGFPGKVLILQRNPKPDELQKFSQALGREVYDFSDLNDNLEQMLALLNELEEQICVSNTNVHLRYALGKASRVLVPNPPDWRWMTHGRSPWFQECPVYRQTTSGDWSQALLQLQADLAEHYGGEWEALDRLQSAGVHRPSITWLTTKALEYKSGALFSALASTRYRVLIPMRQLMRKGYPVHVQTFSDKNATGSWTAPEIVVVSKTLNPKHIESVRTMQQGGARLVVDICDNHFTHPEFGPYHRELIAIADEVVASTLQMASVIAQETGREPIVVGDPCEGERGNAGFAPEARLKLLWFGHATNMDTLVAALPALSNLASKHPLQLEIITSPDHRLQEIVEQVAHQGDGLALKITPWTPEATWRGIAFCDIVIIPTLENDRKAVKSPNRLVESLWGGRFVVAGSIPSYQEFSDWVWIGDDLTAGIEWAISHPGEVVDRIKAAQDYISTHYSASAVAQAWEKIFEA